MWLFFGEACSWVWQIKCLTLFYGIVQHFKMLLLISNGNNTERISFVLTNATKQCKWHAKASRLKLLLFEVPQRWVQYKDADTQSNVPFYSGPNICFFGFLFLFFFCLLSISILIFLFPLHILFSHILSPEFLFCYVLTCLSCRSFILSLLYFFFATFFLIIFSASFLTILSISRAPVQFHLFP